MVKDGRGRVARPAASGLRESIAVVAWTAASKGERRDLLPRASPARARPKVEFGRGTPDAVQTKSCADLELARFRGALPDRPVTDLLAMQFSHNLTAACMRYRL